MRTLNKNKTKLWYVEPAGMVDVLDSDGFKTGEKKSVFGLPTIVYLQLSPSNGDIVEQIFGKESSLDMISVSTDVVLSKFGLLFLTEPINKYDTTYDYKVVEIKKSLNSYNYGLRFGE